jgi:hypothetical protein
MFGRFEPGWVPAGPPHPIPLGNHLANSLIKLCAPGQRGRSGLPHGAATDGKDSFGMTAFRGHHRCILLKDNYILRVR